jgi:post-segregation antitoxin (ccd killing protein)
MAKFQVYLPDQLRAAALAENLNLSKLLRFAVIEELKARGSTPPAGGAPAAGDVDG